MRATFQNRKACAKYYKRENFFADTETLVMQLAFIGLTAIFLAVFGIRKGKFVTNNTVEKGPISDCLPFLTALRLDARI